MPITKVALLGTRGHLAPFILTELVNSRFQLSVLLRSGSSAIIAPEHNTKIRVMTLPPTFPDGESELPLAKLLDGQDAVVISIPASKIKEHEVVMNACVRAGVRRMVPADYGSVSSSDPVPLSLLPSIYANKTHTRNQLMDLASKHPSFTWTSLVCGHFFDYGLESDLLAFDLSSNPLHALIFDDGNKRWSASTRSQIGRAVVDILEHEDATANQTLHIQSFSTCQNELLAVLAKVTGRKFEISNVRSDEYIVEKKAELDEGRSGAGVFGVRAVDDLIAVLGLTRADWRGHNSSVSGNEVLELKEEEMEQVVREVWERMLS